MLKSYVKLFSKDVHAMDTLDGIDDSHVLHGKAVQRVEVFGIVVHVKPGQTKTLGSYGEFHPGARFVSPFCCVLRVGMV